MSQGLRLLMKSVAVLAVLTCLAFMLVRFCGFAGSTMYIAPIGFLLYLAFGVLLPKKIQKKLKLWN